MLLGWSSGAAAQGELRGRLSLDTPEGCVSGAALSQRVNANIERNALGEDAADLLVAATIERTAEGFEAELHLEVEDEEVGQRELAIEGDDCRALDESLALILALVMESPEVRQEVERIVAEIRRPQLWLGLDGGVIGGRFSTVTGAVGLHGEFRPVLPIAARLSIRILFPQEELDATERGAQFWGGTGTLAGCVAVPDGPVFRLQLCVGPALGWVSANPRGLDFETPATKFTFDVSGELRASLFFGRIALSLTGIGAVPILHHRYTFDDANGGAVEVDNANRVIFGGAFEAAVRVF
ncbi:MAG: hypothetical protein AAGF12_05030 [Myxococcota bacterium]